MPGKSRDGTHNETVPCGVRLRIAWALAWIAPCAAQSTVGSIDFFAAQDEDVNAVQARLSVRAGDAWGPETRARLTSEIRGLLGRMPSEVSSVCCDDSGRLLVYVGLADGQAPGVRLNPEPEEPVELPDEVVVQYRRLDSAWRQAAATGGDFAREDHSGGYALSFDPEVRAIQLRIREHALNSPDQLFAVALRSSNARHRAIAADSIGYGSHSARQIEALLACALDPDREVRNNAIRALSVLASSGVTLERAIPHEPFVNLLASGTRSDRTKSLALLAELTKGRDRAILEAICQRAWKPLVECARWSWSGHAYWARVILGRIGGMDEETVLAGAPAQTFVDAAIRMAPECPGPR